MLSYKKRVLLIEENLYTLLKEAKEYTPGPEEKIAIFSDLHLGDGGSKDDFKKNSRLFRTVLQDYYLKNNYTLILNGDIEELQKFPLSIIIKRWKKIYRIFKEFKNRNQLFKIVGNHDYDLFMKYEKLNKDLLPALVLRYGKNKIFIIHGHQASHMIDKFNMIFGFMLRYFVKPLGITNRSTAYDSKRRFKVEKKVYNFSTKNKLMTIIGHTHRPLFESLSKLDFIKFEMENLIRGYPNADEEKKKYIHDEIIRLKKELDFFNTNNKKLGNRSSLYNNDMIIPCLFNTGCAIGKRGISNIEIQDGKIFLVYWFNIHKHKKYLEYNPHEPQQLNDSGYYRLVLNEDYLDYIFTRIKLLA